MAYTRILFRGRTVPEEEVSPCRARVKKGLHSAGVKTATASHRPRLTIQFRCVLVRNPPARQPESSLQAILAMGSRQQPRRSTFGMDGRMPSASVGPSPPIPRQIDEDGLRGGSFDERQLTRIPGEGRRSRPGQPGARPGSRTSQPGAEVDG